MTHQFIADAMRRSERRNRLWYQKNLILALEHAKDRQERDVDVSIALAKQLMEVMAEPLPKPTVVPPHELVPAVDDSLMKPIEPEVRHILHGSTEKGAAERYLKVRNRKPPEDKYFFRVVTSWDYGWQQKEYRMRARDVNHGRCAILRDTFYRKNNLAPDPPHYAQPSGGEFSICSEYQCHFS